MIKVPYSKNPVYVAEGFKPPVVAGRSFEYETSPQNVAYWQAQTLEYRQCLKKEADGRGIDPPNRSLSLCRLPEAYDHEGAVREWGQNLPVP